jgi:hypothetical protein
MSMRNDLSQVSGVSPIASALTLQTSASTPPNAPAASATHFFSSIGSPTSNAWPWVRTPLPAKALAAAATSSPLRAQSATLAPSAANRSQIARPMPLLPPVTRAFLPFNPRSMIASPLDAVPIGCADPDGSVALHLLPIARAFERGGGLVDRRLVEMLADQHQPNRQPLAHAAG